MVKLAQLSQPLLVGTFGVGRCRRIIRANGRAAIFIEAIVPGVDVVQGSADRSAIRGSIAKVATQVVRGDLVSAANLGAGATTAAPASLIISLAGLSLLCPLPWPFALPGLLARLAAQRILSSRRQRFNLVAEAFHMVERRCLLATRRGTLARFCLAQPLLRLVHLLTQLFQPFADTLFHPIRAGVHPSAQPVRRSLHTIGQVSLVHASQRFAQFRS